MTLTGGRTINGRSAAGKYRNTDRSSRNVSKRRISAPQIASITTARSTRKQMASADPRQIEHGSESRPSPVRRGTRPIVPYASINRTDTAPPRRFADADPDFGGVDLPRGGPDHGFGQRIDVNVPRDDLPTSPSTHSRLAGRSVTKAMARPPSLPSRLRSSRRFAGRDEDCRLEQPLLQLLRPELADERDRRIVAASRRIEASSLPDPAYGQTPVGECRCGMLWRERMPPPMTPTRMSGSSRRDEIIRGPGVRLRP